MKCLLLLLVSATLALADDTNLPPMPPTNTAAEIDNLHARISYLESQINRLAPASREPTVSLKDHTALLSAHTALAGEVEQLKRTLTTVAGPGTTGKVITSKSKFTATCPYCKTPKVKSTSVRHNGGKTTDTGSEIDWTVTYKCPNCKETFYDYPKSFVPKVQSKLE